MQNIYINETYFFSLYLTIHKIVKYLYISKIIYIFKIKFLRIYIKHKQIIEKYNFYKK